MNSRLGFLADSLNYLQKMRVSSQVRLSHLKKADKDDDLTEEVKARTLELEKWMESKMAAEMMAHPAYPWFSQVKGVGRINIGKVVSMIDIGRCPTVSSLWRYALGAPVRGDDGKVTVERAQKGAKLHYNKQLKTMVWRLAKSLIRAKGAYYDYYVREKEALKQKVLASGRKVVPAAQLPKIGGKKQETADIVSLGHIDSMAMRKMAKLFLSHLWAVWRQAEGLPVSKPYAVEHLGHTTLIDPWEFVEKADKIE